MSSNIDSSSQVADQLIVDQTLPTENPPANDQKLPNTTQDIERKGDFEKFDDEEQPQKVGYFGTIMNLLNSILGVGILAGPFAMRATGLFPSLFLLVLTAVLSNISSSLLIRLEDETNAQGIDDLSEKVLGSLGQVVVSLLTLLFCITCNLAYLIIAINNIVWWFAPYLNIAEPLWRRSVTALIYSLLLPVALSIPKSITFLSYISTFTILLMIVYFGAMIAECVIELGIKKNKPAKTFSYGKLGSGINVFQSIALLSLGFTLPLTASPILAGFRKELKPRRIALAVTTVICLIIVAVPSAIGYLLFGDDTQQVILANFLGNKLFIGVGACFFVAVTLSYPCLNRQILASWSSLIFGENDFEKLDKCKYASIQFVSHVFPVCFALVVPASGPILQVCGAIGGCIVDFSVPALLWLVHKKPGFKRFDLYGCVLLFLFGLVSCGISLYFGITDIIHSVKSQKT